MTSPGRLRSGPADIGAELLCHAAGELAGSNHVRRHESQPFTAGISK